MGFQRLIRFKAEDGKIWYGDTGDNTKDLVGTIVPVLTGDPFTGLSSSGESKRVKEILCPLEKAHTIICIGLNYQKHATEASLKVPPYPVVFTKPPDALAGPFDDVPIHPGAQVQLDYEGEMTVVIGKDGKNISEADALHYILGYTAGNDVSARNFQLPDVSGGQFCYAKSFDAFAPIGPCIVSPSLIPDPQKLTYTTKVNGEIRQKTGTDDMIWSVRQIIAHLSRGTTLRHGTVIMTGTPSGVGFFMKDKDGFLKDGDTVEVEISGIGAIRNKMVYEK